MLLDLTRRAVRKGLLLWRVRVRPSLRRRRLTAGEYWSHVTVTGEDYKTQEESLESFHRRNDMYTNYIDLMPVAGHDGETILDYGCGPGNDLIGFSHYSRPARIIGCDVSPKALSTARRRINLHHIETELIQISEDDDRLPFEDQSIDYIHSSGVLHHVPDPLMVLREFHRILAPGGLCRIMVYNHDSIWLHLYVAYQKQIVENRYPGLAVEDAFAKTTDGEDCPISRAWRPSEFMALARTAGFACRLAGCAVSVFEMSLLPTRFGAISTPGLGQESRRFLTDLTFDSRGLPLKDGEVAGVDAVYELTRDSGSSR